MVKLGELLMTDEAREDDKQRSERRAFLEQCGRFAAVTPPVVTLMLTVSDKAKAGLLTSGAKTTTTAPITSTVTVTTRTTTTTAPTPITTSTATTTASLATSLTQHKTESVPVPSGPPERLAMMIDSMGLMKL